MWKGLFGKKRAKDSKRQELQNKCHGEQNEGFFADKVILVEGNTELYALPIYLEKSGLNIDQSNISLIQAAGVDAVLAVQAIFLAFGIPVYVIFDGDKPAEEEYSLYQNLSNSGLTLYKTFVNTLQNYVDKGENQCLLQLRRKAQKVRNLLPSNLVAEIEKQTPDIHRIKNLADSIISPDKLESIKRKANRNRRFQKQFGIRDNEIQDFMPTAIHQYFTVWEYNFEENISKIVQNYEILHREAKTKYGDSKPLIAKYIASRATVSKELKNIISDIKTRLNDLTCMEAPLKRAAPKCEKRASHLIWLLPYASKQSVKVFSCAGGPMNPMADDPIDFAEGDIPEKTEFIIKISGDSMEPELPDGAYVAVEKLLKDEPSPNQFCIVCLNGDSICKQFIRGKDGNIRLISRNKKYGPILVSEDDRFDVYGTVIKEKNGKPCILHLDEK